LAADPNYAGYPWLWDPNDPNYPSLVWDRTDPTYPYDPNDPNTLPRVPMPMPPGAITTGVAPGALLRTFTYDGLGRLIRVAGPDGMHGPYEEYVYDGSRRIQTLQYDDPNVCTTECGVTNYIYGPGYVDEFVCQITQATLASSLGDTYYYLQDDNYNVVGLVSPAGEVVQQYVYSPYGRPLISESFGLTPPANTAGHQGLFAYTIDGSSGDPLAAGTSGTAIFYYNRNRILLPHLGRFAQADMNESAIPTASGYAYNAASAAAGVGSFSAHSHYGDGLNLYQYLASNPINMLDPDGLDAFQDDIDDLIASYYGDRAAGAAVITAKVGMAFNVAQTLGYAALTMLPGAGIVELAIKLSDPDQEVGFWDYMGEGMDVAGQLGKLGGKFVKSFFKYSGKIGESRVIGAAKSVVGKGAERVAKYGHRWMKASLDKAISRHAGSNATSWISVTGKKIFENPKTGRQVVVDPAGYFRIWQPKAFGSTEGNYLDLLGKVPTVTRRVKGGAIKHVEMSKDELLQATHFLIE
jgi:hypothetical protein